MALNKEYFDSLGLEVVKKKYYNANKVDTLLADIRRQAEEAYAEEQRLRAQLQVLQDQKEDIGSAVLSAQTVYKTTLARARQQAESIVGEAIVKRDAMLSEAAKQQENAVRQVGECYRKVKEQYEACIDAINVNWQECLCGLATEGDCAMPDLAEKVDAIAQELNSIKSEEN